MNRLYRKISALLAVILLAGTLSGCSGGSKINDTLDEFEYAARNMDIKAMLDCIDPLIADPVRDVYSLYHLVAKEKVEESFEKMIKDVFGVELDISDFLTDLSFEDRLVKVAGSRGTVKCRTVFEIKGEPFKRDTIIIMRKKRGIWYIAGVEIDNSDDDK